MNKILFDSHAHLNYDGYSDEERAYVVETIEDSEVAYVIDIGFDLKSSALAASHAAKYPWCFAAVGVHPHDVAAMDEDTIALIRSLAAKDGVKAIGEIGLDYYRNLSPREDQQYWFRRQIRLALELGAPISIHDRDSHGDTMDILKEEGAFSAERRARFPKNPHTGYADARVLLHCYSGSAEQAEQYIKLGATISIAGPVTYKNNRKTAEVAEAVPLAHLLIETDAPYLSPEPFRGKPNSSPFVEFTAKKIAAIRGVEYEELALATLENGKRFFEID
jgi:TatD DNase family protein